MSAFFKLLTAAPLKDYRTQVLGGLVFATGVANWLVGDLTMAELLQNLPAMVGGLGLSTLGAKVNGVKDAAAPGRNAAKAK